MTKRQVSNNGAQVEKRDRRIPRTRQLLRDALVSLILERGYEAVTVQDITERANLNRATFYLHYRDKDDLLLQSGEEALNDLVTHLGPIDIQNMELTTPPIPLLMAFQHVATHADFYRVVLGAKGIGSFMTELHALITRVTQERLEHLQHLYPDALSVIENVFIANYVAGALVGVIAWWLENDMPHAPEYMADRFAWLSITGCYSLLGLVPPKLDE